MKRLLLLLSLTTTLAALADPVPYLSLDPQPTTPTTRSRSRARPAPVVQAPTVKEEENFKSAHCSNPEAPASLPIIEAYTTRPKETCYRPDKEPLRYSELRRSEHRMMVQDNYTRKSGTFVDVQRSTSSGNYLLRRIGNNEYQAVLNLDFVSSNLNLAVEMKERTRSCLAAMRPWLRGPRNELLDIQIINPSEALALPEAERPEPVVINVSQQPFDYRGDARNFGSNFTCATIGHEILHHLGLADEYYEEGDMKEEWSCRPITAEVSYMRNMYQAFEEIVPLKVVCECDASCKAIMAKEEQRKVFLASNAQELLMSESSIDQFCKADELEIIEGPIENPDYGLISKGADGNIFKFESRQMSVYAIDPSAYKQNVTCTCPEDKPFCNKILSTIQRRISSPIPRGACPYGTQHISTSIMFSDAKTKVEENKLVIYTKGNGTSILRPAQFKKILSGNCKGGSPSYEACEPFAYMNETHPGCQNKPAACDQDQYYLNGARPQRTPRSRNR